MYDVIICGAWPGGATAANYLTEEGIKTLLLDSSYCPKDKTCGGGLCLHIDDVEYVKFNMDKFVESESKSG